jgi:outer membrane protein
MGLRFIAIIIMLEVIAVAARPACGEEPRKLSGLARSISLQQCIEQALARNLDLKIERINPQTERWSIVREQSAFEPVAVGQVDYVHADDPLDPEQRVATGLASLKQQRLTFRPALTGRLPLGTQYELSAHDTRYSGDLVTNFLFTGGTALTLTQPLLKNFGWNANMAGIRVARKNREIASLGLTRKIIDVVSDVSIAYYALVFAIENHKASLEDLHSAEKLLAENRTLVQAGMLSPLEVTQAEAGVAERQEAVIEAEVRIKELENALRLLMAEDVEAAGDSSLLPVDQPTAEPVGLDRAASIGTALEQRSDYLQAKREVERRGIMVQYNRQQLWPQIDLKASYGWNGTQYTFGSLVDDVASRDHPEWSIGVVVSMPLGNGRARADYETTKLDQERALLNLKRLEQTIVVDVANAVARVRANLKRIEATQAAQRLAAESLRAEQHKLREGLSTSFIVLQAQAQLTAAQSAEISARAGYNQSLIELARAEGSTLRKRGIVVDEKF